MNNLNPPSIPPTKAFKSCLSMATGMSINGVAAVLKSDAGVITLIAPDINVLEAYWNELATIPLQLEGIQQVALFDQSAVQELQK